MMRPAVPVRWFVYLIAIGATLVAAPAAQTVRWPSFRGEQARGIGEGAALPLRWNAATGAGIAWRVPIRGLSHASPIVWDDRVYVLSALGQGSTLDRTAQGVVFATDTVRHEWTLTCIDLATGAVRWTRAIHTGTPRQARHVRGTYANATPVTDGRTIVVSIANEGLFGLDMDGARKWHVPMAPDAPDASLDPASSPVIVDDLAIVQNDWRAQGFAAAYELATGRERWRVERREGLAWATPGVWRPSGQPAQVVFNSPRWIRGHEAATGVERWRIDNAVASPWDRVPTPVPSGDLLVVGGGGTEGPLLAIRASARGELSTTPSAEGTLAWRQDRSASYLPTPLVHEGLVYVVGDTGIVTVYRERDGSRAARVRLAADAGTISASPVAAGGRIYVASQDGDLFVHAAGESFTPLARNAMGEAMFATPAIAGGRLIVRTVDAVYAIGATR
ncbi:MAG TPA: PQQ-binding-like beta-propeller repeat protein [Vicinamibacterales bacterium]|nr:PQQ-binding-like beta-propeller repeat protein [Vicinamibacterales bacterium]